MEMDPDHSATARPCTLCGVPRKLEQSHIIPQFVYRWANRETLEKGGVQVGPTRPMLCGPCEDSFSFHESEFARHVFHPFAASSTLSAKYGAWLRKFAASVCWRILEESLAKNPPARLPDRWAPELASCRGAWRRYLMAKRPDVGTHHLHLLTSAALPRLSLHTIEGDVLCGEHGAFVYAKLGPIILLGLIADPSPGQWAGTRINAEGKLKSRDVFVPVPCLDSIVSAARSC